MASAPGSSGCASIASRIPVHRNSGNPLDYGSRVHQSSLDAMIAARDEFLSGRKGRPTRILDIGSQSINGSYRDVLNDPAWTYVGLDMVQGDGVDVVVDQPYRWKEVATNSFDVVVSGQAFEHVEFPWVTMLEIERVLSRDGIAIIIAPSGGEEHRFPFDCWRFYPDGFRALASWADLATLSSTTNWNPPGTYDDDSVSWADSVLVAKAVAVPPHRRVLGNAKRAALRHALGYQASRRRTLPDSTTSLG